MMYAPWPNGGVVVGSLQVCKSLIAGSMPNRCLWRISTRNLVPYPQKTQMMPMMPNLRITLAPGAVRAGMCDKWIAHASQAYNIALCRICRKMMKIGKNYLHNFAAHTQKNE